MKLTIMPIVIGTLGTIPNGLVTGLEALEIRWFGWFVWWHINLCMLFNAKAILLEEQWWCYLTHNWGDKGVHTFPKGICPKVNVIARLEFELACYDFADHRFNHYTTGHLLEIRGRVETIQTTILLRSARILRRVMETWEDLLSFKIEGKKPSGNACVKNSHWS